MSRLKSPESTKLSKLFADPTFQKFIIPHFQRGYVWNKDQADVFWTDFMDNESYRSDGLNLIGTIILCKRSSGTAYDIVDGQQRLITVSLLIAALRDIWQQEIGDDDFKKFLNGQLFSLDPYSEEKSMHIMVSDKIRDVYDALALRGVRPMAAKDSAKALRSVHEYFTEKIRSTISNPHLKTPQDKAKILKKLHMRLFDINAILITLENEEDAYEVFESFNAKSVELKAGELLKNLFLSKIKGEAEKRLRAAKIWTRMEDAVSNTGIAKLDISTYIRYYWIAQHPYVTERDLYRSIQLAKPDYEKLLNSLVKTAENLEILFGSDYLAISGLLKFEEPRHAKELWSSLQGLKTMRAQTFIIWLIALLNANVRPKWVRNSIKEVENFTFQYFAIASNPSNRIERLFSRLSMEVATTQKDKGKDSLEHIILTKFAAYVKENDLLPSKEDFVQEFLKIKLRSGYKPFIKYILTTIEDSLRDTSEVAFDEVNIEHILPQSPSEGWELTPREIAPYVDLLGNLTILDFRINSSIKNAIPKIKIEGASKNKGLKDSELNINHQIIREIQEANFKWNEKLINRRQKELAAMAYACWSLEKTTH